MSKKLGFLLIFLLIWKVIDCDEKQKEVDYEEEEDPIPKNLFPTHARLVAKIFEGYDETVAPIMNSDIYQQSYTHKNNETTDGWALWYGIDQMKIIDLDEPQELFTTSINILLEWQDLRLKWRPSKYDGIRSIFVRQERVWSPPFGVFSASDVKDHRDLDYRIVEVVHTGTISEYVTMRLTTNCALNMHNFPFDTQTCEIHLGLSSVNYNLYDVYIQMPEKLEEMICDMRNSAWDIVNITVGSLKLKPIGYFESRLGVIRFVLKRNPIFYIYMIILPTFTVNMIAIGGVFLKKSTQMEKLTIGFTHIMTMTFILGLVSEKIPKTSEIPLLGKYIIFGLCMMIFALISSSGFHGCSVAKSNNRRYIIFKYLKIFFVTSLQLLNILAFSYMIYRFSTFEMEFGKKRECDSEDYLSEYRTYSNMSSLIYASKFAGTEHEKGFQDVYSDLLSKAKEE
ncbi:unnamed protein product [Caenorhabditis angaria]|uniref:Neurotransmitter-gated ion-channel ligand-binding domain-containing protein n=1 Tax=Caenorhabditis angaria TaxID=860376 RepID=A0A9P1IJT8_9PELO|nr:unnamed protein product [Caenorhabditis angaria]